MPDFEAVMTAIGTAYWNLNYSEFCIKAGFSYDSYSEEKWQQFQQLVQYLNKFDPRTLARICA